VALPVEVAAPQNDFIIYGSSANVNKVSPGLWALGQTVWFIGKATVDTRRLFDLHTAWAYNSSQEFKEDNAMAFLRLWLTAYRSPALYADGLRDKPAPQWGLAAVVLRGLIDSLLLYLPIHLMGWQPPTPSFIPIFSTEHYYRTLIFIGPLLFLAHWLMSGAFTHIVLRLTRRRSDIDLILNILGMTNLVIAAVIIAWDWLCIAAGWGNQYILGISHLVIDTWGIAIAVIAFKRLLGVPIWLGILLQVLGIITWLPLGMIFMRSPL